MLVQFIFQKIVLQLQTGSPHWPQLLPVPLQQDQIVFWTSCPPSQDLRGVLQAWVETNNFNDALPLEHSEHTCHVFSCFILADPQSLQWPLIGHMFIARVSPFEETSRMKHYARIRWRMETHVCPLWNKILGTSWTDMKCLRSLK